LLPVRILKHLRVAHQARNEDQKTVEEFYQMSGINADVKPFFVDISRRINEAQLIISRAGASTIAEISIIGRPSILVPLKVAVRDEQTKNASSLVQAKAAIIISEDELTALKLKEGIYELIRKPTKASEMAEAAYANSKPNASKKLLELVESLYTNTKEESFSAK
ncbi:MAG: glycosyltransferase, partial [Paracoccaceae bacterium]|nr:glycosyltransferase [Paracoccaceae bacterium]